MKLNRLFILIFVVLSSCQNDESKSGKSILEGKDKKYYSLNIGKDGRVTSTYESNNKFPFDIKTLYNYSDDRLKKKTFHKIYNDSIAIDSILYSYKITDSSKKETSIKFTEGQVIRERNKFDLFKDDLVFQSKYFEKYYDNNSKSIDTIEYFSTFNYSNDKITVQNHYGSDFKTFDVYSYNNDHLREKLVIDSDEGDTIKSVEFFYDNNETIKIVEINYWEETILTLIYDENGFLKESYWSQADEVFDTVQVNYNIKRDLIEYYWNQDFYPKFILNLEDY